MAGDPSEIADAELHDTAAIAVEAIRDGLAGGRDPREVVKDVLNVAFGRLTPIDLNVAPHEVADPASRIGELLCDPAAVDRIIAGTVALVQSESAEGAEPDLASDAPRAAGHAGIRPM